MNFPSDHQFLKLQLFLKLKFRSPWLHFKLSRAFIIVSGRAGRDTKKESKKKMLSHRKSKRINFVMASATLLLMAQE